jgi:uncharacterized membrane protein YphA (DoxX/SURF4 family)
MSPTTTITVRREPGPLTRSLVALLLRVGLGMLFLIAGLGKFDARKAGKYPGMITEPFEKASLPVTGSPLPPRMVKLFADVLPYAEVGLGATLIVGFWMPLAAVLTGALLLNLFFGKLVLNDVASYPGMLIYLLVDAAILWLSPVTSNYLSLDGLLFGWFWAPRSEGAYRREEEEAPLRDRRA